MVDGRDSTRIRAAQARAENTPEKVRERLARGVPATGTFVESISGKTGRTAYTEAQLVQRESGVERIITERGFSGFDDKARRELIELFESGDTIGVDTETAKAGIRELKQGLAISEAELQARIKSQEHLIARRQELTGGELKAAERNLGILQADLARLRSESQAKISRAEQQISEREAKAKKLSRTEQLRRGAPSRTQSRELTTIVGQAAPTKEEKSLKPKIQEKKSLTEQFSASISQKLNAFSQGAFETASRIQTGISNALGFDTQKQVQKRRQEITEAELNKAVQTEQQKISQQESVF